MEYTLNHYLRANYSLLVEVSQLNEINGVLIGDKILNLNNEDLEYLYNYENIYNLLNNSNRLLELSYLDNQYILRIVNFIYEGPYTEDYHFIIEETRTNYNLLELLSSYDKELSSNNDIAYHKKI